MLKRIISGVAVLGLALGGAVATASTASAQTGTGCNYTNSEPTLSEWSSNAVAVQQLQCELNRSLSPASHTPLTVDGSFGPNTLNAVKTFQGCAGDGVDGVVGPQTWASLDSWAYSPNYVC
ncbi:peptidoglycan-binding domain-containing protein [Kitasatospora sp. NPDC001159]